MILANILRFLAFVGIGWILADNGITATTGLFWIIILCLTVIMVSSEYLGSNK